MDGARASLQRPLGALLLAASASTVTLAAWSDAAEEPVSLAWLAPARECPDSAFVQSEVRRLLGAGASRPEAHISARAEVRRDRENLWRVVLSTASAAGVTGRRELTAKSCPELAEATALILAMTVDPVRVALAQSRDSGVLVAAETSVGALPTATSSPPQHVDASAPSIDASRETAIQHRDAGSVEQAYTNLDASPPPPPVSVETPKERGRWGLAAMAIADVGTLPTLSPGIAAFFSYDTRPITVSGGFLWLAPQRTFVDGSSQVGGDFQLLSGFIRGCASLFRHHRFAVEPCAGVELGQLRAASVGAPIPGRGSPFWAALQAGGHASLRAWGPLWLRAELGLVVPMTRPDFILNEIGLVYRPSVVAARGGLGVEVLF